MKKISLIIAAVALIASSAQANTNKVETKAAGTTANTEASNNGAVVAKKPVAKAAEAKNAVNSKETTVKQ